MPQSIWAFRRRHSGFMSSAVSSSHCVQPRVGAPMVHLRDPRPRFGQRRRSDHPLPREPQPTHACAALFRLTRLRSRCDLPCCPRCPRPHGRCHCIETRVGLTDDKKQKPACFRGRAFATVLANSVRSRSATSRSLMPGRIRQRLRQRASSRGRCPWRSFLRTGRSPWRRS